MENSGDDVTAQQSADPEWRGWSLSPFRRNESWIFHRRVCCSFSISKNESRRPLKERSAASLKQYSYQPQAASLLQPWLGLKQDVLRT